MRADVGRGQAAPEEFHLHEVECDRLHPGPEDGDTVEKVFGLGHADELGHPSEF